MSAMGAGSNAAFELANSSSIIQLEEDGEDACNSDVEVVCAKIHDVDIVGGNIAM